MGFARVAADAFSLLVLSEVCGVKHVRRIVSTFVNSPLLSRPSAIVAIWRFRRIAPCMKTQVQPGRTYRNREPHGSVIASILAVPCSIMPRLAVRSNPKISGITFEPPSVDVFYIETGMVYVTARPRRSC